VVFAIGLIHCKQSMSARPPAARKKLRVSAILNAKTWPNLRRFKKLYPS